MNSNALANAVIRQEIEALQNTIKTLRSFLIHFFLDDSTTETSSSIELTQRSAPTFLGVFDIDGEENHTGDTVGFYPKDTLSRSREPCTRFRRKEEGPPPWIMKGGIYRGHQRTLG